MKDKNSLRILFGSVILIFAAAAAIIAVSFLTIRHKQNSIQAGIPDIFNSEAHRTVIKANPGGDVPTQIPLSTPTALSGMDSPIFCKLELNMIYKQAEVLGGGGMLIPARYEQSEQTCVFTVREKTYLQEIGSLRVVHKEGEKYGVHITISDTAGGPRTDPLTLWGTASLCALDAGITQENARTAVQSVLTDRTSSVGMYDLSLDSDPLAGTTAILILDRTKN